MSVGGRGPAVRLLGDLASPVPCGSFGDLSSRSRSALVYLSARDGRGHRELYFRGSLLRSAELDYGFDVRSAGDRRFLIEAMLELAAAGWLQSRGPQAWALSVDGGCFDTKPGILPPRESILERDRWECRYCFSSLADDDASPHLDHVFPRSRGGWDDAANVVAACASCNTSKGARTPSEWRR
jgi:hypothetical protein